MHAMLPLSNCPQKQSTSTRVPQVGFYGCGNNFYLIPAKSLSFCPSYPIEILLKFLFFLWTKSSFSFKSYKVTVSLAQTLFLEVTPEHTMFISTDTMLILVPGMRWIEMNCDDSATHVKYSDRFVAHALDTEFLIPEALTCSSKQVLALYSE